MPVNDHRERKKRKNMEIEMELGGVQIFLQNFYFTFGS